MEAFAGQERDSIPQIRLADFWVQHYHGRTGDPELSTLPATKPVVALEENHYCLICVLSIMNVKVSFH